ncbi:potassium channel subfamily K member 15-like [Stylophora pistillata]|uniref:potassium channel subfamily K member 15-like n=1 Tax=Stylophora pistillata TaxID=50429 RepID=UPI000C0393F9|nr:potassium channel subfamily K member 15-like [Stylophora pistillata]
MKAGTRDILIRFTLVGLFLLIGAAVFQVLEGTDQHERVMEEEADEATLEKMRTNLSVNMSKGEFDDLVNKLHKFYEDHHQRASSYQWTFYASLYFSSSVITTIGYGHMAPSTFSGRLFCVFYALFGIPLCMLALKSIGERINELIENGFILISSKFQLQQNKGIKIKVLLSTAGLVLVLLMLGGLLYLSEGWSYFDGVYYCFIALSTIGFGDMIPRKGQEPSSGVQTLELVVRGFYIVLGLALVSSLLSAVVAAAEVLNKWNSFKKSKGLCCHRRTDANITEELGPASEGLYTVSRNLDNIVFPSVIPFRRFASDGSTPLINDPRWLY